MSNTEELEGLLGSPYRWSSTTYSSFILVAYNVIIEEMDRLHNIHEDEKQAELEKVGKKKKRNRAYLQTNDKLVFDRTVAQFVQNIIDESYRKFGSENWVDIIGSDWELLKLNQRGVDICKLDDNTDTYVLSKKTSAIHLFKLVRDKLSHLQTYKGDMKGKMTYFFDKDTNGVFQFSEYKFVSFWINKFPKLIPYMWLKFSRFRGKLAYYYPDDEINTDRFMDSLLDLNKFVEELQTALLVDIGNGNVLKRFKGENCSLEFRGYYDTVKIKDDIVCMDIVGNSTDNVCLSVSNSTTKEDKLKYMGTVPGVQKIILVFCDNIKDEIWKYFRHCDGRVIVFSKPINLGDTDIKNAVATFRSGNELKECPIRGAELSREKIDWIFEQSVVNIQGRDMKIKDIFVDSSSLVEVLSGNLLNKLLKNEKPTPYGKYEYPEYKGVYIERELGFVNRSKQEAKLDHIYVTVNCGKYSTARHDKDKVFQVFNDLNHLLDNKNSVQSDCEFILLENHQEISDEIIEKCEAALCSRVVRFHDFGSNKTTNSRVSRIFRATIKSRSLFDEAEFLKITCSKNIKTYFFLAKSGMGKSKLLLNLGKRLESSLTIFYSFRTFVDSLQKQVGDSECSKLHIKSVIIFEILKCEDECEKNVIDYWLERRGNGAKIELQLDGFDEVHSRNCELALEALEIFEKEFDSVRLWITSSNPFPNERKGARFVDCSISVFSYEDQINFFKQSWGKTYPKFGETKLKDCVRYFLNKSIQIPTKLLDYPLNCSMLADLYEDKVTELTTPEIIIYKADLYESLVNKKFALMLRRKINTKVDESDNDFKLLREIYFQLHTYFALTHLFQKVSNKFMKPFAMKFLTAEDYCKMGIITSTEQLAFVHVTYAEFFVARHIFKVLETGELDSLCFKDTFDNLMCLGTPDENREKIRTSIWKIVDKYLGTLRDCSSLKWFETHNKEQHSYVKENKVEKFLKDVIKNKLWNLAELLINVWVNEKDIFVCNKILHLTLESEAPSKLFLTLCEKLSFDNEYELLIYSVKTGQYEIAKYFIEVLCEHDVFNIIAEKMIGEGKGGIFHCIADGIPYRACMTIEKKFYLEETKEFIRYVHDKNKEEVERKNGHGLNFLLALPVIYTSSEYGMCSEDIFELKEFLIKELGMDVNERSCIGESVLCFAKDTNCDYAFDEDNDSWYEDYCNFLSLVASKKFAHINLKCRAWGLTPLYEAVYFFGWHLKEDMLKLFRDSGANFNETNRRGDPILHYCVKYFDDIELIILLVEYGGKIDFQNGKGLCALCLAEKGKNVRIQNFFREKLRLEEGETCKLDCNERAEQE